MSSTLKQTNFGDSIFGVKVMQGDPGGLAAEDGDEHQHDPGDGHRQQGQEAEAVPASGGGG